MPDLKDPESNPVPTEEPVKQQTPETEKKVSKPKKATGRQARAVRTSTTPASTQASSPEAVATPAVRTSAEDLL